MSGPIATAVSTAIRLDEIAVADGDAAEFSDRWITLVLGHSVGMLSTRHELHRYREEQFRAPMRRTTR